MASDDSDEDDLFDEEPESPETKRRRVEEEEVKAAPPPIEEQSLHNLIAAQKWNNAVSKVTKLRLDAPKGERIPELHEKSEENLGMTPLQAALESSATAPASVIDVLVDEYTVKDRNEFLPACPCCGSTFLNSPLLKACGTSSYPDETIMKILHCDPKQVLEKDVHDNMSVFHVLLQEKPSLALVELLVETFADQKSISLSQAWKEISSQHDGHGVLVLHYAIQEHAPSDVILKFVNEYPDCILKTIKDRNGKEISIVHHAAYHGCSYPVLKALLEQYGAGKLVLTRKSGERVNRNTPLHLVFHTDMKQRWMNQKASNNDDLMPPRKMVWFLLKAFSENLRKSFGAKKGDPKEQAHLLVFKTRGEGNKTIYERATELFKQVKGSEELKMVLSDINAISRYDDFPHIDFDE